MSALAPAAQERVPPALDARYWTPAYGQRTRHTASTESAIPTPATFRTSGPHGVSIPRRTRYPSKRAMSTADKKSEVPQTLGRSESERRRADHPVRDKRPLACFRLAGSCRNRHPALPRSTLRRLFRVRMTQTCSPTLRRRHPADAHRLPSHRHRPSSALAGTGSSQHGDPGPSPSPPPLPTPNPTPQHLLPDGLDLASLKASARIQRLPQTHSLDIRAWR